MQALLRNVRYAIRLLGRTPGFTITVVLTLALAIGANGAVFATLDAVLLRPLGFPDADRLVLVSEARQGAPISNTAPVRIEEWNESSTTFEAITGWYTEDASETSGDLPQKFRRARVAPRFLDAWGVSPALGRGFLRPEHDPGAPSVVLISHRYWVTQLDSDPNALERTVRLGEETLAIVGVMPESFRFPDRSVDLWVPRIYEPYVLARSSLWYSAVGRMKPGVSVEQARADLGVVQARAAEQYPDTDRHVGVHVESLKDTTVGSVRGSLWLLFGSVTVLLLIASTNIAALLLSRSTRRRQEIALRLSLGASTWSVAGQVLTETTVLAFLGTALGLGLAVAGAQALVAAFPEFPRLDEMAFDGGLLLYALTSIVAVTLICGVVPAIRSARVSLGDSLAAGRRTQVATRHSLQWLFVGVQVALSVVLLAGAGLLIRSFLELSRVDPGFEASRILTFRVSGTYEEFFELAPRVEGILDELRLLQGVEASATSSPVPGVLDDGSGFQFVVTELQRAGQADAETPLVAQQRVVSPSYFDTMQIPLLGGGPCRAQPDGTPADLMVNSSFVTRYGASSGVGAQLRNRAGAIFNVAGVVGDSREFGMARDPVPTVYTCRLVYANPALAFLVRTRGEPTAVAQAVRAKIKELEPLRAVWDVAPLADRIGNEQAQDRLRTLALTLFAGTALALACLGIYGTLSYVVSLRRREVGLRVALGALQGNIVAQFVGRALRVVGIGCAVGVALSFASAQLLSGMLFGVSPSDPLTLAAVLALVTTVGLLAALLPAVRASRVPPMEVLREE